MGATAKAVNRQGPAPYRIGEATFNQVIWQISDALWAEMAPLIEAALPPRSRRGRPRPDMRPLVDSVLLRMRTGAQWRTFPKKSTLHHWFQTLNKSGVWEFLWMQIVDKARAEGKVDESRAFLDGNIAKAPLGGDVTGPSPVHRARRGTKRSVMTDGEGYPISIVIGPANRHDSMMLAETLAKRIIPLSGVDLVLDNGYRGRKVEESCEASSLSRLLPPRKREGEPLSPVDPRQKGRWKVERAFAWLHAFRGLEQRLERKAINHIGLLHLLAALVWWRRIA